MIKKLFENLFLSKLTETDYAKNTISITDYRRKKKNNIIIASVALIDNKIIRYKIGGSSFRQNEFIPGVKIISKNFISKSPKQREQLFDTLIPMWINQWALHEKFKGIKPNESVLPF